jgi:hypothetical protein
MAEEKEDYYSFSDIITKLKQFFSYLKTQWLALLLAAVIGGGLGASYYYYQSPKYEGTTTFILQEKSSSLSSLSGLASSLGLDMASGSSGLFVGDNILDILQSRYIVKKVLLSDYIDGNRTKTLINLFLDFKKYRQAWKNKPTLTDITFPANSKIENLSLIQDSVIEIVYKALTANYISIDRTNKKASIIRVEVTSKNSLFSKYMSERLVAEALTFYVTVKTSVSKKNVDKLERKSDSILMLLNEKSYTAANLKILDPNPANKTLLVPNELINRDKQVLLTLYGEVVKNLEIARMTLAQETPVIQILDTPQFPLYDNKKGFLIVVIGGGLLFFAIACFYKCMIFFKKTINANYKS